MDTKKVCFPARYESEERMFVAKSRINQQVGQNLQTIRLGAEQTLAWLSSELGVAAYEIERWEAGLSRVPADCLLGCAKLLRCSLPDLFEGLH
jgi:hypothetical protein